MLLSLGCNRCSTHLISQKQIRPTQRASPAAALTNNGVLVDYLHVLKNMKAQLNNVQMFLDAHIRLLEEMSNGQPQPQEQPQGLSWFYFILSILPVIECPFRSDDLTEEHGIWRVYECEAPSVAL